MPNPETTETLEKIDHVNVLGAQFSGAAVAFCLSGIPGFLAENPHAFMPFLALSVACSVAAIMLRRAP